MVQRRRQRAGGRPDALLSPHPLCTALGKTAAERRHADRELFRHHWDHGLLHAMREAVNHALVLGRSYFKDSIAALTQRQTRLGNPGRPRVGGEAGGYYIDEYISGNSSLPRVFVGETRQQPAFTLVEKVRVIVNNRNKTHHFGTIRKLSGTIKIDDTITTLKKNGKKVAKRYYADDLQKIERTPNTRMRGGCDDAVYYYLLC